MKMKLPLILLALAFPAVADEKMNMLQTALSATTISGYVDTSIEWNAGEPAVTPPPQVATNNLVKIPNWGTDILHYFVRDSFTNAGLLTNATASVDFKKQVQGRADHEDFTLTVAKLQPTNTYTLWSLMHGETNYVPVASFTTGTNGSGALRYKNHVGGAGKGMGRGHAYGHGKQNKELPAGLTALTDLTALAIADANTNIVLAADLVSPDRLHYLVKRKLERAPLGALLQVQGTTNRTHFRLTVLNLLPTTAYWLALNDTVVQTNTADARGRLMINTLVAPPKSPLDLQSVKLLDSNTNVLLSTELP
jgi:hypothetical protein